MMVANAVKVLTNEIKKGDAILDIGAGPGVLAGILEGIVQNCFIYGVESNPVFHKNGKELAKRLRRNRYFPVFGDVITNHFNGINPIDVVCFSRSLHELSKDLDERIKVIDKLKKYTKPNAKVIISDPFYITEIHEKPEENAGKISLAREYLQRTLGHSHIPNELPAPETMIGVLNGKLQDIKIIVFEDELTEATEIIKTYWLIGKYCD